MILCFHKWGEPDYETRYQKCEKCNKVRIIPCAHVFERVREGKRVTEVQCKRCGIVEYVWDL